jgi:3-phosphoshikimate 1-carboxyvinyltransferase
MRLLAGLLAGQPFESVLTGDESLSRRPMDRIAQPLREMGARIELNDGRAPIHIKGGSRLHGIEYVLPVASAQVKSAVLLAGLYAEGSTVVVETTPSRDHTERMLALPIEKSETQSLIRSDATVPVEAVDITLPGDISSAAFFMVGALIVEDSSIRLTQVGINPSRTGIIDVLERAGAVFEATGHRMLGKEPVCDLTVSQTSLDAISVTPALAPRLIDEIPILAVAAARAGGISSFEGIGELRAKESDRIDSTSSLLRKMGASVSNDETSLQVAGGATLTGANIDGCGDHRIVMAAAIAGLAATGETRIAGAEAANVSYPGFWDDVERLAVR